MQSYASTASLEKDRSRAIALNTGGLAFGICVGPGESSLSLRFLNSSSAVFQLLFIPIGYPGVPLLGGLRLNMYTAPALASCLINLLCVLLLGVLFKEDYAGIRAHEREHGTDGDVPPYDRLAALVCYVTRFMQLFVFTNLET